MNDEDLIWNSLSRKEKESLGRAGLASKIRKRRANQRARERKQREGLVRMEVNVRPEHRADLRKLVVLYSAARCAGDALQVIQVPLPDGGRSAVLEGVSQGAAGSIDRAAIRDEPSESPPGPTAPEGRLVRRSAIPISREVFFSDGYSTRLAEIIAEIVDSDGPLPIELLRRQVARRHGWHRAGALIARRIDACLGAAERHDEDGTTFVWAPATRAPEFPSAPGPTATSTRSRATNTAGLAHAGDSVGEGARLAGPGVSPKTSASISKHALPGGRPTLRDFHVMRCAASRLPIRQTGRSVPAARVSLPPQSSPRSRTSSSRCRR